MKQAPVYKRSSSMFRLTIYHSNKAVQTLLVDGCGAELLQYSSSESLPQKKERRKIGLNDLLKSYIFVSECSMCSLLVCLKTFLLLCFSNNLTITEQNQALPLSTLGCLTFPTTRCFQGQATAKQQNVEQST